MLEEILHQERIKQLRTLEEGQVLEETLRQNMLQQSHHAQFQQNVDVKNQQLEAQIARIQLEKAESDSKLSHQNEQMDILRAHYESNRIRDLSLSQANQALHHVDTQVPAHPSKEWQPSTELRNPAGGNPTRTDEPTQSAWQPKSMFPPPEFRNQAGGNPFSEAEKEKHKSRLFAPTYNMAQGDYAHWDPLWLRKSKTP